MTTPGREFQETPTQAGYDWLLTEPLFMHLLDPDAVLAYDETHTYAAILDTEPYKTEPDAILTVNGQIINWGKFYPALRALLREIRDIVPTLLTLRYPPIDYNPMLAPGQTESNYVNKLDCGHELDTETELPVGSEHYCSQHGLQKVVPQ
jgi:hypothetical protein